MPSTLPYLVLSTSSRDAEKEAEFENAPEVDVEGNEGCWVTDKNRGYPQSMVLQLDEETFVHSVRIVAHKDFPPSSLTVSLGLPDSRFSNSTGKSYNADYSSRQELSFKEHFTQFYNHPVGTALFSSNAFFVRISIHGFIHSAENTYRQVVLLSVQILRHSYIDESVYPTKDNFQVYTPTPVDAMPIASFDDGALLPLRRPDRTAMPRRPDLKSLALDSDSEDEVVIFTRDMINRIHQNEKTPLPSPKSGETSQTPNEPLPELAVNVEKEKPDASPSPPLSSRTRDEILAEIRGVDDDDGRVSKNSKRVYVGKRMAEFNNLIRLLERKKEVCLWEEKYGIAHDIQESVAELQSREAALVELLEEREDYVSKNDLISAQRSKDRFDKNMSDALNLPLFRKFLTRSEMKRLGIKEERMQEVGAE